MQSAFRWDAQRSKAERIVLKNFLNEPPSSSRITIRGAYLDGDTFAHSK